MSTRSVGKYRIQMFDPSRALRDKAFNIVLLGKKASGKSTLMRDILYHLYKSGYPRVVVFSGTESMNHFFSEYVPSQYIHYGLDVEVLTKIVHSQEQVHSAVKDLELKLGRKCGIDTRLCLVLDDIVFQRGVLAHDVFRRVFFQGRHFNISIILASQYLMFVPVEQRANIDYLVCMKENIPKNRVKLWESFFGCFDDKSAFFYVLDQLTQNYEVCILDNTGNESSPENQVKWYKAQLNLPHFKFQPIKK